MRSRKIGKIGIRCVFFPWKNKTLSWKFLDFRPWNCDSPREKVLKTGREKSKVPVKFFAKSLWRKTESVGVKKMKITARESHESAREKKSRKLSR